MAGTTATRTIKLQKRKLIIVHGFFYLSLIRGIGFVVSLYLGLRRIFTMAAAIATRGIGFACASPNLRRWHRHHLIQLPPSLVVEPSARVQIPLTHHICNHRYHSIPMVTYMAVYRPPLGSNPLHLPLCCNK